MSWAAIHIALRADKTEQKVELRSSKNTSLNKKPSGVIDRTKPIMCCKTINNNFRNLSYLINSLRAVDGRTTANGQQNVDALFLADGSTTVHGGVTRVGLHAREFKHIGSCFLEFGHHLII